MRWKASAILILLLAALNLCAQEGSFPVIFNNLAKKSYPDSLIFIYSIGMTGGKWCYMAKDGSMLPMAAADANAAGHLIKNGKNFPNYCFRLSEAQNFRIPPSVGGGRLYISVGSPLYMTGDATGVQLPDPNNPGDPNEDVFYDWFEYTYIFDQLQFGGNTTQVDLFGFPFVAKVKQEAGNGVAKAYEDSCGIAMPRDQIIRYFQQHMSAPFQGCIRKCRVVAPRSSSQFQAGGAFADYMKPYVDSLWDLWKTSPLDFSNGNNHYIGTVDGAGKLQFTGAETGSMGKPSSSDIFACAGFPGYVGAALSAAFNRGVARNGGDYYKPETYYQESGYKNEFSQLLHAISIHKLAYGFGYDDNNNQSSVLIVGSSKPLTSLTITIEPFVSDSGGTALAPSRHPAGADRREFGWSMGGRFLLRNLDGSKGTPWFSADGRTARNRLANRTP